MPRILIVDDDISTRDVLAEQLSAPDREMATAADGFEALATARTFGPHLVITDIEMPQMSGWELFVQLRGRRETALTPVIFATALGARHDRMRGLRLGAVDYVVKPIDLEELSLRVTNALDYGDRLRESLQRALAGGVAGNLVHLPLGSLLQVLALERRSGVLDVRVPELNARVLLRNGDVVAARPRDKEEPAGTECIYTLLKAHDGRFLFTEAKVDVPREIHKDTMLLLLEGARRLDEEVRHGTASHAAH
jgi:CheY-like chemotaxis protein